MLIFKNILYFPPALRERNAKLNDINSVIQNIEITNNNIIITGLTNGYVQVIQFLGKNIDLNTNIKISCTCKSFEFEFSYLLHKVSSLANSYNFLNDTLSKFPKDKNQTGILSGCKHVISLGNLILKNKQNIIKNYILKEE